MKKALFLDRDGIINIDHGYVSKKENFEFSEGIFEFLHLFIKKGYLLFIVTNQSGIGRGYYTIKDFDSLTEWMLQEFEDQDIVIQEVVYCPHAPEENCQCRKPQTGMIDTLLSKYPIDLANSWLIGDKQSDIDLAVNSNIANCIAIGDNLLKNSTYHFNSILECKSYIGTHPELL